MPRSDRSARTPATARANALFRRHPALVAACAVVGLLLGGLYGLVGATTYTAESRLLVGTFTAPSTAIPGYVLAAQTLAGSYARLATSGAVLDNIPDDAPVSRADVASMVTVTAVPDSALIRLVATSSDADRARQAVDTMAQAIDTTVRSLNQNGSGQQLLDQYRAAEADLAQANAALALAQAQVTPGATGPAAQEAQQRVTDAGLAVGTAQLKVDGLKTQYTTQQQTLSTSSQVRILGDATATPASKLVPVLIDVVLGGVLGALVGLAVAWWRERPAPTPVLTGAEAAS